MTTLSRQQQVITSFVLLHLIFVVLFIWTDFPGSSDSTPASAMRTYKNLSGCFRDYSFFAPLVASDLRAGFHIKNKDCSAEFIDFVAPNKEIGFRYNCIIASCMRDAKGRDLFTQSWSATILGEYPDADKVRVLTEAFEVPTMKAYSEGAKPEWALVYFGDFERE